MAASTIATGRSCTRCEGSLDSTGYPLWCLACRAKHKREYERTKKEMQESRGYAAGVTAMREYLAKNFQRYGTQGSFTGIEIAQTIMRVRGPFDERAAENGKAGGDTRPSME